MFGLQLNEIIVTLIIALIIFGPQRLPEIARGLGKAIREFRETSSQVQEEFRRATDLNPQPEPAPYTQPRIDSAPISEASIQAPIGMAAATIAAAEAETAPISEASMLAETTDVPLPTASDAPTAEVVSAETTTWVSDASGLPDTASVGTMVPGEMTALVSETTPDSTVAPGEATTLMSDAPGLAETEPAGTVEPIEAAVSIPSGETSEPPLQTTTLTGAPKRAEKDVTDTDNDKSPPSP